MHICFITNEYPKQNFPHGGIGTFIKVIANQLVKLNHKVSVIGINNYTNRNEEETDAGVNVYRLKPKKLKGVTWLLNSISINAKIKSLNNENVIDIVESAELGLAFISKIKSIKYVIRLHGGHHFFSESENRKVTWWKAYQEKRSFRSSDGFIAVSNYVKSHTEKYLSYNDKPLIVLSSPVNTNLFTPNENIIIDKNNITFVGTVCEKKGIRQLILAMGALCKKYPNLRLNIYGRDWFFKNGESYIHMLNTNYSEIIKRCIIFHGAAPYNTMPSIYSKALVCVFPSHMETQGLVALEAMLMEKAVIFTKNGPGPELIIDKETGLLCNPTDSQSIKEKIEWIINHPNERMKIASKARDFAYKNYKLDHLTKKNIDFYNLLKSI
ncbi:glycosyltransferase family 4 protein [Flavobacteriaceae bacterium]|nr:glycosyltransferase family 4 protein [Flavobacteriaceae bacterium]